MPNSPVSLVPPLSDTKTSSVQEARKYAADQCGKNGKQASLVTDNTKPYNIRQRTAVFQCR